MITLKTNKNKFWRVEETELKVYNFQTSNRFVFLFPAADIEIFRSTTLKILLQYLVHRHAKCVAFRLKRRRCFNSTLKTPLYRLLQYWRYYACCFGLRNSIARERLYESAMALILITHRDEGVRYFNVYFNEGLGIKREREKVYSSLVCV